MSPQQLTKSNLSTGKDVEDDGLEMRNRGKHSGTDADMQDMRMLGKTQQLNVSTGHSCPFGLSTPDTGQRNFRFISTLGFACTLMSTWEIELT
jgi:choline transport protein